MTDEPTDDELDELAADLVEETDDQWQENREEQEEFLETVAEEEGAEVLETQCNLIGEYVVPLKAKLNGDLLDRMGAVEARLERIQNEEAHAYEVSEVADDVAQILDTVIDDPSWSKSMFYQAYKDEGVDPLGVMLERCFKRLQEERERRQGTAEGFRKEQ